MVEGILLAVSLLFFVSIVACKAGYRFGVPVLLLFLAVGMIFGPDGIGYNFDNLQVAQAISTVALCVILFSGGLDTKIEDIRPVLAPGSVLATLGVLLTTIFTGLLIQLTLSFSSLGDLEIGLMTSMLIAAMMSSTDSASVFSILRGKGLHLKNNLRPLLELESGSNDPMAYLLTITLISLITQGGSPDYIGAIQTLILQLLMGSLIGYGAGKLCVWLINRLQIDNESLYPIAVFTACIFLFSVSYFIGGNSYLAVYIGGVVMGNSRFVHKHSSISFFDGLSWLAQLTTFLLLGLLVYPHELVQVIIPGLIISFLMIFISRPASVFICLAPFKTIDKKSKIFISWVGLRGAVPIIFGILALVNEVPHARTIFNIVFVCTLVSLIVQGTSLGWMANKLGLTESPRKFKKVKNFDMEFSDDIKSVLYELHITDQILNYGNKLLNLPLPENCLAVMAQRGDKHFIPNGKTELKLGDIVLLMTDNQQSLTDALLQMGVNPEEEVPNTDSDESWNVIQNMRQTFLNRRPKKK